jgi:purine-binding chemotaxis protein CheW
MYGRVRTYNDTMVEELQFVGYKVGTQQFVIEIHRLFEILSYSPVTPMPGAPPFLEGIIDLRGELVPVIDLRKKLGGHDCGYQMQTRILIVRLFQQKLGFIVDSADQVYTVPVETILPPPESSPFILAVIKQQNELMMILDLEKLLTETEQLGLQSLQLPLMES